MNLIVIDPRRTETARRAQIYIQPRPGQDASILAAMIHVILAEALYDKTFTDENVAGVDLLRKAVMPFEPAYAAARADTSPEHIVEAARVFAKARRGLAVGATGANMSGRSTLTEYLLLCLNTICGRYMKEGEAVPNPGVLLSRAIPRAQAKPPRPAVFPEFKMSVRGLSMCVAGMPTAALADEILNGRIRALLCLGGNPAAAIPDQNRTVAAIETLDLFVQMDIKMSASSKLAHYVIPPRLSLEIPTMSTSSEFLEFLFAGWGLSEPFGMYAPKLVDPPPGSDLLDEWELFYALAQRLGLRLKLNFRDSGINSCQREPRAPIDLDMNRKPTLDELFELATRGSRIPLTEVKKYPNGALFPEKILVAPKDPACTARLDVGNAEMMSELGEVAAEAARTHAGFPFIYIGRRTPSAYNSSCRDLPMLIRKGGTYNPAFMHPADLTALGLTSGDVVEIISAHGSIRGIVQPDDTLKRGLLSMSHSFGDLPRDSGDFRRVGSNTSQLTSVADDYDHFSGIPRMSALPVKIIRADC
jgi:anaerobic selenocysteine-containing dehydrogenase